MTGVTSAERNLLRVIESYSGTVVTPRDLARRLGVSWQAAVATAGRMEVLGLLSARRLPRRTSYELTGQGRAELTVHGSSYLLIEVDDRLAGDILAWLAQADVSGIEAVSDHGGGCCCQHCPHKGNCRP